MAELEFRLLQGSEYLVRYLKLNRGSLLVLSVNTHQGKEFQAEWRKMQAAESGAWHQGRSALDFLSQILRGQPVVLALPP
jgi:hypothetical protein